MHPVLIALALGLPAPTAAAAPGAQQCAARSGDLAPHVVELYTSEGCSSCPPADRWVSSLKGRTDVVALAFHVDYWDRLGWKDRYASPAWTQRQYDMGGRSGSKFVYTPQVLLGGRDYRRWPGLPQSDAPALVALSLSRDGASYVAQVARRPGVTGDLAGYWAVTEDGHRTQVKAGENAGSVLAHDAVVRELQMVASIDEAPMRFTPQTTAGTGQQRRVQFVVTDAQTGVPVQALGLGC